MKCKCGFEGEALVGDYGMDMHRLFMMHFKCPKCGSTEYDKISHIDIPDVIRKALLFPILCKGVKGETRQHRPAKQHVRIYIGGADLKSAGYSIYCPACRWGSGGGMSAIKALKLLKEFMNNPLLENESIPFTESIEERIFKKILCAWEKRVGKGNVDEVTLRRIIKFSNTDGDGKKRITFLPTGKTHLVPIEDIFLDGVKGVDISNYPVEEADS